MRNYKTLNQQVFGNGEYLITPIRHEDRFSIMKWRNEQIYHLRQSRPLTEADQDAYFENIVAKLFDQEKSNQILFSYLQDGKCIGYGGLVHINWVDKNAEISFIMDTSLEKDFFELHWKTYLKLIEQVAFEELGLHKLFTFAFDLRPHLYPVLERSGYIKEAVLKEHCLFEGDFKNVVIHCKISASRLLRKAAKKDVEITYNWASNPEIRKFSFNTKEIDWESHQKWFNEKVDDENCEYYILFEHGIPVGSIRFDIPDTGDAVVSYLIDPHCQGQGLGKLILALGLEKLKQTRPEVTSVRGLVLNKNLPSINIFSRLDFSVEREESDQTAFIKKI